MSDKTQSILIGGLAAGVLAMIFSIPQNCLGCVACLCYVGSGLVAVWHYTKTNSLTIKGGEGASIGAMAGVACGVVVLLLSVVFRALDLLPGVEDTIRQMEENPQFDQMDPGQIDFFIGLIEFMYGAGGYVVTIIIAVILGVIGGAIRLQERNGDPG